MPAPGRPPSAVVGGHRIDWTGRDVLSGVVWFVAIFVGGQIFVLPVAIAAGSGSTATYAAAFVIGAIVEVLIGVVAANYTFRRYGGGIDRLGWRPISGSALAWALAAYAGAMAVSFAYGALIQVTHADFLKSTCAQQIPETVRSTRWLLAMASLVVVAFAPVFEETFFRGFVFPGLARIWGVAIAVVVSELLFSSAHLDYKSFVPIAGVGMVFAVTYWRSGNLVSTVLAHFAFNSTSIAAIAAGSCDSQTTQQALIALAHNLSTLPAGHWL